jgi:hypothetical protein
MNRLQAILPTAFLIIASGCGGKSKTVPHKTDETIVSTPQSIEEEKTSNVGFSAYNSSPSMVVSKTSSTDSPDNPLTSSATGVISDSTHKYLKTADLKFRVNNVIQATYQIEDLTRGFGGLVQSTHLESRVDRTTLVPVSQDSSLETVYYTVVNSMTLRVPEKKLDSLLRSFTPLVEYLDHRTVNIENVYLQLLANHLTQLRVKKQQERMKKNIDTKGKDLAQMNVSEEILFNREAEADTSLIESLSLKDKMAMSTVTLHIYQRQSIKRELIYNDKNVEAYSPGFGYQIGRSFNRGWHAFKVFTIFIVQFWMLIPLGFIGFILYKVFRKK